MQAHDARKQLDPEGAGLAMISSILCVQGHGLRGCACQGKIAPIMANSWVRAFGPLADIRFAGAAEDMMVSKAMCVGRAKFMAPMGMHYMIVLPLANGGVKVCLWASEEACSKFGDDVSVTNFE